MEYQKFVKVSRVVILFLAVGFCLSSTARAAPGDVDLSFNAGVISSQFSQDRLTAIAVQTDGKIVVAGNNFRIGNVIYQVIRLNPDGSLDSSFSLLPIDAFRGIEGLALQADGKILIGGDFAFVGGVERRIAARLKRAIRIFDQSTIPDAFAL